ncbi:uncharacterized protein LOC131303222 [Rhododendron vialii]|uniref:uncharacterized protein LOC131303222 n=1 Tax=Rhododendron vialii TaxID=182163 RepID=UPI00265FD6EA|nr:uncharacterized protein LOC131303222 [Rhododendron vialii]
MVIKNLVSFIWSFIGYRGRKRIKSSSPHEAIGLKLCEDLDGAELCCVCLSSLEEGGSEDCGTRVLPCLHEFHRVCIATWFSGRRKTCPVCRFLVEDEEKPQTKEDLTEEMVIWFSSFHVAGF